MLSSELILSSGIECYNLELMLSSGAHIIIWDEMLSRDEMLSSAGANVIILS
jgi:hypothetical protein